MRAVVLSGGLTHDFPATTGCLTALLGEQGLQAEVHPDVEDDSAVGFHPSPLDLF